MEEKMITIPIEEYKELLKTSVRVKIFAEYVNNEDYRIGRENCGKYLGFEVEKKED